MRKPEDGKPSDEGRQADPDGQRMLVARAFSQIVDAQRTLAAADLRFVNYLIDIAKLEMAAYAVRLIGSDEAAGRDEAEMVRWFKNMGDEETARRLRPPEAS